MIKEGTILIAKDECVMENGSNKGKASLKIGDEYPIERVDAWGVCIINERGDYHTFNLSESEEDYWGNFFDIKPKITELKKERNAIYTIGKAPEDPRYESLLKRVEAIERKLEEKESEIDFINGTDATIVPEPELKLEAWKWYENVYGGRFLFDGNFDKLSDPTGCGFNADKEFLENNNDYGWSRKGIKPADMTKVTELMTQEAKRRGIVPGAKLKRGWAMRGNNLAFITLGEFWFSKWSDAIFISDGLQVFYQGQWTEVIPSLEIKVEGGNTVINRELNQEQQDKIREVLG